MAETAWSVRASLGARRDVAAALILGGAGALLCVGPPFALSAIALLLALAAAVASPTAAAAAAAAATPLIFHPIELHGAHLSLLELALLIGAAALAARIAADCVTQRSLAAVVSIARPWTTTGVAAAFVVVGTLSLGTVADAHHLSESLREYRLVILEPIAVLFLARWSIRRDGGWLIIAGMIGAGMAVAVVAVTQLLVGFGDVIGDGVRRAKGPYRHPNSLALYLERVFLFATGLAVADRRLRARLLPATVILAAGLAATLSRGALLAVAAGGAVIVALVRPPHGWRYFAAAVGASIFAFAVVAGGRLVDTGSAGTTSTRELLWRAAVKMVADHPLFGVGLDQFLYQYAPHYVEPAGWAERYTSHPHNLILDAWLSLGVPGLVVFGLLAAICLGYVLRLRQSAGAATAAVGVAAAAVLAGGAAHGLVDNGFFLPDLATLTWLAVAFLESAVTPERSPVALEAESVAVVPAGAV
jgi:putative inorganic carbon (hco3(-)) transporter